MTTVLVNTVTGFKLIIVKKQTFPTKIQAIYKI